MEWKWDVKHQAALLAWKCNHRLMPCKASGYACPFIKVGDNVVQFKKCAEITPWDWQNALEDFHAGERK